MQFSGSTLRSPGPDVSVESQPNANSAGKYHSRAGRGGDQEVKGKKHLLFSLLEC